MRPLLSRLALLAFACSVLVVYTTAAFSQETAKKPAIKQGVAPQTSPSSGPVMFREYCAACHGPLGEGNGPAATALKKLPANLTLLTRNNKGTFPQKHVEDVLKYGVEYPAHGSSEMPVWGPTFRALSTSPEVVTLRVANLIEHLKGLQK